MQLLGHCVGRNLSVRASRAHCTHELGISRRSVLGTIGLLSAAGIFWSGGFGPCGGSALGRRLPTLCDYVCARVATISSNRSFYGTLFEESSSAGGALVPLVPFPRSIAESR